VPSSMGFLQSCLLDIWCLLNQNQLQCKRHIKIKINYKNMNDTCNME
jgi:hypothetical protein